MDDHRVGVARRKLTTQTTTVKQHQMKTVLQTNKKHWKKSPQYVSTDHSAQFLSGGRNR